MSPTNNTTRRVAPNAVKALIWEFIWRLGSATVLVFGVVMVLALSMGGCTSQGAEQREALLAPDVTAVSTEHLSQLRAELFAATHVAEAASESVVTLGECRNSFWRAIEQPPAAIASWNQAEHLDYLVQLVRTRDRCEDHALLSLAGQVEL